MKGVEGRAVKRKRKRPADYPGKLPRFPICAAGREGCRLIGDHAHRTVEERARVYAWFDWFDWFDAKHGGISSEQRARERRWIDWFERPMERKP